MLYQLMISLAAFRNKKADIPPDIEKHRFAALIAARNEENVIAALIASIRAQNYPSGLIDIIVVADNCTDSTARVAEQAGATVVYERFNKTEIGKGYVIRFALEKIMAERDYYDAFCVFDADNIVDPDFFAHMNLALNNGAELAQGYRDMKNPTDNWIAGGHAIFYWMENRFFDYARAELGLSAIINGTGFMFTSDYVRQFGYNAHTITEDVELTVQSVINGKRVEWVPHAKVYDEQPVLLKQSMAQRSRWVSGFIQNSMDYFRDFWHSIKRKPTWVKIDLFLFLISMPVMMLGIISMLIYSVLSLINVFEVVGSLINMLWLLAGTLGVFWLIGFASVFIEGKNVKSMLKAILMNPIFNATWGVIWCKCIFVHSHEWTPITHGRNLTLDEIESIDQK
jgi:cellulose synthase/poly-beta-1,6-N-acetylglucosamine synthase-like glycosyltransferase